jgi:protein TonB
MSVAYAPSSALVTTTDRLSVTIFLAICAHLIVVIGVSFVPEDRPIQHTSSVDIVLVQRKTETAPKDADFIGQANQLGSGEQEAKDRPSTPLPSPVLSNLPDLAATAPQTRKRNEVIAAPTKSDTQNPQPPAPAVAEKRPVLAAEKSTAKDVVKQQVLKDPKPKKTIQPKVKVKTKPVTKVAKASAKTPKKAKPKPAPVTPSVDQPLPTIDAATLVRRSLAMASLSAEVNQSLKTYSKRPRTKWVSASTRESKYAAYMEAWRAKVERIGNLNFPDEARRKNLSGSLLMMVAIKADGSIQDIKVRRSSGHRVLDDAARHIVSLSAPFARFTKAIKKDVDILYIERTWQFSASNRFASR